MEQKDFITLATFILIEMRLMFNYSVTDFAASNQKCIKFN